MIHPPVASVVNAGPAFNEPAVMTALEIGHWLLIGAGAVVLAVLIVRWLGSGKSIWRPAPMREMHMPFEMLLAPVIVYFLISALLYPLVASAFEPAAGQPATAPAAPENKIAAVTVNNLAIAVVAVVAYAIGRRFCSAPNRPFILGDRQYGRDVTETLLTVLVAFALCYGLLDLTTWIVRLIEPEHVFPEHGVIEAMNAPTAPTWLPVLLWLGTVVATPIAEETFFRGLLQTYLAKALPSRKLAVVLAGAAFGAAHLGQPQVVPAMIVFGMIVGTLYERRGGLLAPILAHALFNAKSMLWETLGAHAW